MPKLYLSNDELNDILRDYNSGMSMADVSKKYHHNHNTLKRYFLEHNIDVRTQSESLKISPKKINADKNKRTLAVNDDFFTTQNHEMAYIIGFLAADGNVSKNDNRIQSCLSIIDKEQLINFQKLIGGTYYTYTMNNKEYCGWYCYSSKIKKKLSEYGIVPHKTGTIKLPSQLEDEFIKDYIRGYFDGDGSICKDKNGLRLSITSLNTAILEDINNYFVKNNIKSSNIYTDHDNKVIKYRTQACIDIYNLLYYDNCLCLKRKKDKYIALINEKYNSTRLRNLPTEAEKVC